VLAREEAFRTRVVGVIRSDDSDAAFRACVAAMEGGIGTIEVTMTVPSCLDIVRGLVASTGGSYTIGVGSVLEAQAVAPAKEAGAAFVVTPALIPAVAEACRQAEILCALGALTPTEVHRASVAGADIVELFPIEAVGGPDYVRGLQGPIPAVPLSVSGGSRSTRSRNT
jgi:2-dehydro-3-deoxyphosphogluconate aldolase / (4S)-4-hydroxy-2-oxoglutarate aldolase